MTEGDLAGRIAVVCGGSTGIAGLCPAARGWRERRWLWWRGDPSQLTRSWP